MNIKGIQNINHLWGKLIIEEMVRLGVQYFCVAPGSRSGPLSVAVGEHKDLRSCVHFDERGLAFHALGYMASSGRTACLISTSGTAAANFFPAVIEAAKKKLPLIILTADRPPELRWTGANQTIDQVKIYGDYVRYFFDLPTPSLELDPAFVLTTMDQAVFRAKGSLKGPVHINCMFREPLAPVKKNFAVENYLKPLSRWLRSSEPFTSYHAPDKTIKKEDLRSIALKLNKVKNGLIAVGKLKDEKEALKVLELSQRLGWPVFSDITSPLRLKKDAGTLIHLFDQVLKSEKLTSSLKFDGILHLGGRMTSKRFYDLVESISPAAYVSVLNHPLRNDPLHKVTLRVESSVIDFCRLIFPLVKKKKTHPQSLKLKKMSDTLIQKLSKENNKGTAITTSFLAQAVTENLRPSSGLFLASSMSIRVMDMFALPGDRDVTIGSNRGASGIDGNLASAIGFALGLNKPCVFLTGDLALLHDLNSLAMSKELKHPLVVVCMNDDGGGIFTHLPIAKFSHVFEKFFITPHGLNFKDAARMFHCRYACPGTKQEFKEEFNKAFSNNKLTIIEIKMKRPAKS